MSVFDKIEKWLDGLGESLKVWLKETKNEIKEQREILNDIYFNNADIESNDADITINNMNNMNVGRGNKTRNIITINGERYQASGNNIVIKNDKVIVNGNTIKNGLKGIVKIQFEGDIANLDCTTATVNGNVNGDVDSTTTTINGNVDGDVDGVTIKCGNVQGDVDGTTVTCGDVEGDVDAVSIRRR